MHMAGSASDSMPSGMGIFDEYVFQISIHHPRNRIQRHAEERREDADEKMDPL
jgi:hypothetical protein